MDNLFSPFKNEQAFIKQELIKIINPYHLEKAYEFNTNSIGIHIRMGDFENPENEQILRDGAWNYRLPMKWYLSIIAKLREHTNLPIYIFSDAAAEDLKEILQFENCKRVFFGSAISDMIALSTCKVLVSSTSTFSMWSSFLGQIPTIWFPGQLRQKLINDKSIFEGEMDYNEKLPNPIIDRLKNG